MFVSGTSTYHTGFASALRQESDTVDTEVSKISSVVQIKLVLVRL
jgi:hypothetical protein